MCCPEKEMLTLYPSVSVWSPIQLKYYTTKLAIAYNYICV